MFGRRKKRGGSDAPSPASRGAPGIGRRIRDLFARSGARNDEFYDNLEDLLVESDFGAAAAVELVDELRRGGGDSGDPIEDLKDLLRPSLAVADIEPVSGRFSLYLVLGVNGVGKTTTIAKMAHRFRRSGVEGITFAAADTFRAAAIEQLEIHADRVGARIVRQDHGSDPGAVVYDAVSSARSRGESVVIADTAGRMHNRANLVKELAKIDRIAAGRLDGDDVYRKILVIDATTGQNGMRQAETFQDAVGVDAVVMTKYDSTAKGGLVAAISRKLGLPFAYLGRGEGMDDLVPFDPEAYLDELLAVSDG